MARPYVLYCSMVLMLAMGTFNMLMLKFQHMQLAPMSPGGRPEHFDHPWVQAGLMMVGECLCLIVYLATQTAEDAQHLRQTPKWIFLVPCCCDLVATALLCSGLAFIAVSVAQMCRGTVIIFACILSFVFLRQRQRPTQVIGVALVLVGICAVAVAALRQGGDGFSTTSRLVTGISLCIFAQVFQAGMFVYEEKIMKQYMLMPLQVVGMEGLFGMCVSALILACLQPFGQANAPGAFYQIKSSPVLLMSVIGSMVAVALFNFAGATVTQQSSSVARTTIKLSSTISIWMAELAFGWNTFSILQFIGFVFVAWGTVIYNDIVMLPWIESKAELSPIVAKKAQLEQSA